MDQSVDHPGWPGRAIILMGLGAAFGLAIHFLTEGRHGELTEGAARLAASSALASGGIVFAFSLERLRWLWSAAFAAAAGLVIALVVYWNGTPAGWGSDEGWQFLSSLLAVAIAVPLFQAARDAGGWRLDHRAVHAQGWTNVILWGAACAFVLVSYLLAQLIAELFHLIGLETLRELLGEPWFNLVLVGAVLGAAVGLLRDRDQVLGLLQRVATTILSVLTPVLAIGLVIFVVALPFTGLAPLWEQTKATTPILLVCILGAFVLVNATLGNAPDEEARSPVLRWAALALGAVMLPLGVVAAVSIGKRVGQYGLTPDRLWAMVLVAIAVACGAAYLAAITRRRSSWSEGVRRANVRLALGVCGLALFLALPIISFGALSAQDQLSRLHSGKVAPEKFDWAALRFDFGPAGREALDDLARTGPAAHRAYAARALASDTRWKVEEDVRVAAETRALERSLKVLPVQVAVPASLRAAIAGQDVCRTSSCTLYWREGARDAFILIPGCDSCSVDMRRLEADRGGTWQSASSGEVQATHPPLERQRQRLSLARGEVEIREVTRRQVFVGGEPVAAPFP